MNSVLELAEKLAEKARILVVDDDPDLLELVQHNLVVLGCEPVMASSGTTALAKIGDGQYDLVLLDLTMPGMDGFELIRQLRHRKITVPIVVMTGYLDQLAATLVALQASLDVCGVLSIMEKPFTQDEFSQRVRRVLDMYKVRHLPTKVG